MSTHVIDDISSSRDPNVPPIMRSGKDYMRNISAMTLILSGNIGIGILTLPKAISNAGLLGGIIGIVFIAYVCIYCMNLLVRASYKALESRPNLDKVDYAETAQIALEEAGGRWERCATKMKTILNLFLCANQIGSNSVYVLFIAQNIKPLIVHYGGRAMENLNYRFYILMVYPFMLAMCSIRTLRHLSMFSGITNVVQATGLGIIFYYLFSSTLKPSSSLPLFGEVNNLPLFFGTAIFAIEGISVVLPIENKMRHPRNFLGCTGVLNISMSLVILLYITMGFYGYMRYGNEIKASITLNLPYDEYAAQITLCLYSMAIFFSYSLQFYVVIDIINRNIWSKYSGWKYHVADFLSRFVLNTITFALAATIPWLDLFVSLLGAVKMSVLSLMAPAIIDTASNWNNLGKYNYVFWKNGIIFIFGLLGMVFGTYVSMSQIIHNFSYDSYSDDQH